MRGWVYIISNRAMPGLFKIGHTLKDPEIRASEMNSEASPHKYIVDYEAFVDNPKNIELNAHKLLRTFHESKEWFRCDISQAVSAIRDACSNKIHMENFKALERQKIFADIARRKLAELKIKSEQEKKLSKQKEYNQQVENIELDYRNSIILYIPGPYSFFFTSYIIACVFSVPPVFILKLNTFGFLFVSLLISLLIKKILVFYFDFRYKRKYEKEREDALLSLRSKYKDSGVDL